MNKNTILSLLIVVVMIFSFLTYTKLKDYPADNACCKDLKNVSSKVCKDCTKYNYFEKIIYVWKFS